MTEHDEELPASKIVEQFGDEIKAAIAAVAAEAPKVAKKEAKKEVQSETLKSHVRWYVVSLLMSLVMSLSVSWLMLNYSPRSHALDITYKWGNQIQTCARDPKTSTEAHPVYICNSR